ncbi:MAG: GNAT family N-acetyltransferase [Chlamydia sp.]
MRKNSDLFEEITRDILEGDFCPIPDVLPINGITIRYSLPQDIIFLKKWLTDPEMLRAYPMCTGFEIEDASRRWISFSRLQASLTIEYQGIPVGVATLHIHWYKRLVHQCDFAIIVHPEYRGRGFGSFLLSSIMKLAKKQFRIELLHLQVYKDNPAIGLYEKFGFREFGRNPAWIKDSQLQYVSVLYMGRRI